MHKKLSLSSLKKIPRRVWIIGGTVFGLALIYSAITLVPKNIMFSYAGPSCASQFIFFPHVQTAKSDGFTITMEDELRIGSFAYAAKKVCVTPTKEPQIGVYTATVGPFGGWFVPKHLKISVTDAPSVQVDDIVGKTISTVLPVRIGLSDKDVIHAYELSIADKTAPCTSGDESLICDVSALGLRQSAKYTVSLYRNFAGADKTKLAEGAVKTLLPLKLKKSSIVKDKVIYTAPKSFQFTFDKPIKSAGTSLVLYDGKTKQPVATTTRTDGDTLRVAFKAALSRKATFTLTLKQVVGKNGSALAAPIAMNFSTSGGPKPVSVSVGSTAVSQNAQIIVKLDQPIKSTVNVTKVARVIGVPGSVTKRSATELVYSLHSAGLCKTFSLVLDKGIASGSNSAVSEAWKFNSRVICGTSSVIGYSVNGRPITAYYFGSGATTVLFTGGMHGSEPSGQTTMQSWVNYLQSNSYQIPSNRRVVIVPNTNPDGIAAGTRNNVHNVNIDRNFPTANWKTKIETASGTIAHGGGKSAGSEPETAALMTLTRRLRPRLEVSFHAQGRLVGANKYGDSVSIGTIYASIVGYTTMFYDAEAVMGYPMTGEYEDWMGEEMGMPAILVELPSSGGDYLNYQIDALMKMLAV